MESQDNNNHDGENQGGYNDSPEGQSSTREVDDLSVRNEPANGLDKNSNETNDNQGDKALSQDSNEGEPEFEDFEELDVTLTGEFKAQLNGQYAYLVEATSIPSSNLNIEFYASQLDSAKELINSLNTAVVVFYGEAYVDDVSLSTATFVSEQFELAYDRKESFRDVTRNDLLLNSSAEELLALFESELKLGDNVRLNIQLKSHPKLCNWLIEESNFQKLNALFERKEAYLILCIHREYYSFDKSLDNLLRGKPEAIYVNWPEILINIWDNELAFTMDDRNHLLDVFPKSESEIWSNKAPRAASKLCSEPVKELLSNVESEQQVSELRTLINKAFTSNHKNASIELKRIVEFGWRKPLKKMLLAVFGCLNQQQPEPVRYKELKAWGCNFLQHKVIRHPLVLQETVQNNGHESAASENSAMIVKQEQQYIESDAHLLWLEHFDELIDECGLSIDRSVKDGLTVTVENFSTDWVVEEFYRRYPSMTQEIYDFIVNGNMLFPGPDGSALPSIAQAKSYSQLLMCVSSINEIDFPITTTLSRLLSQGAEEIIQREHSIRRSTGGHLSRTKSEDIFNYVSFGIAFYLENIKQNSVSLDEYKCFLSEALESAKENYVKTKLLITVFGLLADQKQFATLEYMFEFLRFSQKQSISIATKWWLTMRRVFAYHMSGSLNERLEVLKQISNLVKEQKDAGIIQMTYSRLWFDAIRSDFSSINTNSKGSFVEVVAQKGVSEVTELLSNFELVDPEMVSFSVPRQFLTPYIANMLLAGLSSAIDDDMEPYLKGLHDKLSQILLVEYATSAMKSSHARISNPLVLMKQHQKNAPNDFSLLIYHQFFDIALAEWGASAAGLTSSASTRASSDIIIGYLESLNTTIGSKRVQQMCRHWYNAADALQQLDREIKRPQGVSKDNEFVYHEFKILIQKKFNRYRQMAEYLDNLQQDKGKEIAE
ncbi:hypothetical protein [Pseudoalteromonas luteoviolacea]|uniref:hypothetical protein n=1 Tax=Pseudoalteromonas luteoviolacea TaxID=43657 RepID=UPI00114E2C4D|nr:hypothetical protein [Pseudoalteromonas luteoviolacea]TQF67557.1 hypothetical protein FLM44_20460 [Pseudoalteromonas luteoviolacea]